MAKRRPGPTLEEIEVQLGYTVTLPRTAEDYFFSDLSFVPLNVYDLAYIELAAWKSPQSAEERAFIQDLPQGVGEFLFIYKGKYEIVISRSRDTGYYVFAAEVKYLDIFHLHLLLSASEVASILQLRDLKAGPTSGLGPILSRLPGEVRERIYYFAIPHGTWTSQDPKLNFPAMLGNPSGFYFPLNRLELLQVNKQIRQEALPIAFRKTLFCMDDLDDLTKHLIAVGDIGRENLKSLEFTWQGGSVSERALSADAPSATPAPSIDLSSIMMPTLHAGRFSGLLRQCVRLGEVVIIFDDDIIEDTDSANYNASTGVEQLEPLKRVNRVEVRDIDYREQPQHRLRKLLIDKLAKRENVCHAPT